jgi:hypothetical protein
MKEGFLHVESYGARKIRGHWSPFPITVAVQYSETAADLDETNVVCTRTGTLEVHRCGDRVRRGPWRSDSDVGDVACIDAGRPRCGVFDRCTETVTSLRRQRAIEDVVLSGEGCSRHSVHHRRRDQEETRESDHDTLEVTTVLF